MKTLLTAAALFLLSISGSPQVRAVPDDGATFRNAGSTTVADGGGDDDDDDDEDDEEDFA